MGATSAASGASEVTSQPLRFGIFDVDPRTGEIRKAGVRIRLQEQPFQVLAALLERPGELVTRDQLRHRLWPDGQFLDYDHALTTAVKKLRRALNDSAVQPRYIETLPKRGYRFVAPVERPAAAVSATIATAKSAEEHVSALDGMRRQRSALVVLLAVSAGLLLWATRGEEPPPERRQVRRFSLPLGDVRGGSGPEISPDGRYVAYVAGPGRSIWIRELASEEPRRLDGIDGASSLFWAPNSESLGFRAGAQIKRVSVHGGPTLTVCDLPGANFLGGAWHPSGKSIIFSSGLPPTLREVAANGGSSQPMMRPEVLETGGANIFPAFITGPDGSARAVVFTVGSPADQQIVIVDLQTDERRRIGPGAFPAWDPRGYLLYQSDGGAPGLWAMPFSWETLEPSGPAVLIDPGGGGAGVSADGVLVYADAAGLTGGQQLVWRDRAGRAVGTIGRPQGRIRHPALSSDERYVAVEGTEDDNNDIWIHDTLTGARTRLTYDPAVETSPVWRPDGSGLAYRFDREGNADIFERPRDRSTESQALLATPRTELPSSFSPDGETLVYAVSDPETRYDIWIAEGSPENARPLLLTPFNEVSGVVSPGGRWMAYCSDDSGRYEVYVRRFPDGGSRRQISEDGGCQPRWSRNGRELFYVNADALIAVEALAAGAEFQAGSRAELFRDPSLRSRVPYRRTYDVSGDGRRFVTIRAVDEPSGRERRIRIVENWTALIEH